MKNQKILDLKPTQIAIGMREVQDKADKLRSMNRHKRRQEILGNPIEVVIAPNGKIYVTDGHHRLFAYWLCGIRTVPVEVLYRFPKNTSFQIFWKTLHRKKWVYPYDTAGEGPKKSFYLPEDIRGIGNDPYRSLAWMTRESGGYNKSETMFADFKWGQFFRERNLITADFEIHFDKALKKALILCKSRSASHLPGFKQQRK